MTEDKGRGMLINILNTLSYQLDNFVSDFNEALFCSLKFNYSRTLLLGSIYRSPSSTSYNNDCLNALLETVSNASFTYKLLVGDFNYPLIDWASITNQSNTEDKEFKFVESIKDSFLTQLISKPTRGRGTDKPSLLDLVLTSDNGIVSSVEIASPLGNSDHALIITNIRCKPEFKVQRKQILKYDKGDYITMARLLDRDWVS